MIKSSPGNIERYVTPAVKTPLGSVVIGAITVEGLAISVINLTSQDMDPVNGAVSVTLYYGTDPDNINLALANFPVPEGSFGDGVIDFLHSFDRLGVTFYYRHVENYNGMLAAAASSE